jgi:hypothetical protein
MALNAPRPLDEVYLTEGTTSIASTPVAAYAVAPCSGYISRIYAGAAGTTTGTITVAVAINGGSDIAGSGLTIAAGAGTLNSAPYVLPLTGANAKFVNEGDFISFTPSGGTGSSIGGAFTLVIKKLV